MALLVCKIFNYRILKQLKLILDSYNKLIILNDNILLTLCHISYIITSILGGNK